MVEFNCKILFFTVFVCVKELLYKLKYLKNRLEASIELFWPPCETFVFIKTTEYFVEPYREIMVKMKTHKNTKFRRFLDFKNMLSNREAILLIDTKTLYEI